MPLPAWAVKRNRSGHGLYLPTRLPDASLGQEMLLRGIIVLLLAFAPLSKTVAGSVVGADLFQIVTGYYYAIGENRLEEATSFYHRDSPQIAETMRELLAGRSTYLQRTNTLSLDLIHRDGECGPV